MEHNCHADDISTLDAFRAPLSLCTFVLHATCFYAIYLDQSHSLDTLIHWACWFYFAFGLTMLVIQVWNDWFQHRVAVKLQGMQKSLPNGSKLLPPRDRNYFIGLSGTIMMTLVSWPAAMSFGWITM